MSVLFLFLDGVGLAPAGADNPLTDAPMPTVRDLLGGPLTLEQAQQRADLLLAPIDATLGVPGLPQSGTGQTALFGGFNAAAMHGRHQPAFPPVALRPLLMEQSVLRRVVNGGGMATFANPFAPSYWQAVAARRVRRSASVIATEGAGLRFRDEADLRAGHAVAWDITGEAMRMRGMAVPPVAPHAAGANLARLAVAHDLVLWESFLPDLAGHGRLPLGVSNAMARMDSMLAGLLAARRSQDTLVISSDHGNIESASAPAHTRNPVLLLVVGPGAAAFAHVQDIVGVADGIMTVLTASEPAAPVVNDTHSAIPALLRDESHR
jgi:2,3-bisphosphoglycerate-independent phosphoglycerate mutase